MAYDIGPKVGIEGESEFRAAITNINQNIKTLGTEMKAVTSAYDRNDQSAEKLTAQNEVLNKQIDAQKEKLAKLNEGLTEATKAFGENDNRTLKWKASVNTATADLNKMERQLSQNNEALEHIDDGLDEAGDGMEDLGSQAENTGGKLSAMTVAMGNLISAGIEAAISAVGDLVSSLWDLDSATEEYRAAQGKLQTAYEAAGYSSDSAQTAYREFYKILGDTDTAVEASQLLAKLADNEQDLTKWTQIAAGVSGTFGDSLPIEGLIESANETAKVGQITGSLADALNWAGISEDEFNAKLAECTDESARNRLIMSTLSGTYDEASAAFYRNNEAIVAARDAQASLDESLGRVGEAVANIKTSVQADFMPSITQMLDGIAALASGDESGVDQLTQGITEFADTLAEKAPQAAEAAGQLMGALLEAISASLPSLLEAGGTVLGEIVSGILAGLPDMGGAGLELVTTLTQGIAAALPDMGAAGLELVTTLTQGIGSALPELIPAGVDAVLQLVETLTNPDSLGELIDAALSLITALAEGLIKALPKLAQRTPEIIGNIVATLAANLPKIGAAAVEIILTLAAGLVGAIPELVAAVPKLIVSIVGGFSKAGEDFRGIGKNIVTGVWTGIQNMGRWIRDKVTGFFSGITSAVKGVLGIRSPSRVYRGIGGNMGKSVGIGWDGQYDTVKRHIVKDIDRTTKAAEAAAEMDDITPPELDISPLMNTTEALGNGIAAQMEQLTAQAPDWGREFVDGLRQGIQAGSAPLLQDMGKLREDLRWAFSGEMAAAQRRLDRSMAQLPKEGSETAVHRRDWSKEENPLDYDALAQAVKRGLDGSVVSMSGRRVGQLITSYQQGERRAKGS